MTSATPAQKINYSGALLLTLIFYPLMFLWCVVGLLAWPIAFIIAKLGTSWGVDRIVRLIIWIHGRGLIAIVSPFVSLTRESLSEIKRPCILVVNHQSFFDGYFMAALPFHDITFAVGSWPFKMYWYTMFMRLARYLDVENMAWDTARETCLSAFANGGAVLFFPEGHRSRTGKLQQFYSGAFRMSVDTGIPIVPLCITGTGQLLPPGRSWLHPAKVTLKALPPVNPAPFTGSNGHVRLRKHVRSLMAAYLHDTQGYA